MAQITERPRGEWKFPDGRIIGTADIWDFRLAPDVKAEWLDALRSGEYRQGTLGRLCHLSYGDERFCCLGVLGDVLGGEWVRNEHDQAWFYTPVAGGALNGGNVSPGYLPGDLLPKSLQRKLAAMNDSGCSFVEIADWIEKRL
jgi:hypothetical protein